MKKYMPRIICLISLIAVVTFIFINVPFRLTVDISTYGVLTRMNADTYEVRSVYINGVLTRRIMRHGFGGGHFHGILYIDNFDFLEGFDIENQLGIRPSYVASFFITKGGEPGLFALIYPSEFLNLPHLNIHGWINFSNSLNVFAIRLNEVRGDNQQGWSYEDGLIFVAPAQNMANAKYIYWTFFNED